MLDNQGEECESEAWANALIGRIFWDFLGEKYWADMVSKKIQMKLSKIRVGVSQPVSHTYSVSRRMTGNTITLIHDPCLVFSPSLRVCAYVHVCLCVSVSILSPIRYTLQSLEKNP